MTEETKTFADYGVRQDICDALADRGIVHPFPIQSLTLPVALSGSDIIGQAKTGTGKTLGFGLPAIQRVVGREDAAWDSLVSPGAPQALIVVPTRELAIQVGSDLEAAAKKRNARIVTLYGGVPYEPQVKKLDAGAEIIVGTPGRLIDLHRQKKLNLSQVKIVVLDEADEMLDLGFLPDVERLLSALPEVRQTMLFSATMPGPVLTMARRYMTKPMHIQASSPDDESLTKKSIRQVIYRAHPLDKDELVGRILRANGRGRTIIFTKTKRSAAKLSEELQSRGFAAGALHGDLNQGAREQALRAFRENKVDVLVATDVAARGIDVDDVTHVINFQCPEDEKTYVHRVGRTGRAAQTGTAVTLVDWEDVHRWSLINKALELGVPEPVETYSSSDHLFADLDIPAGTKGRLPKEEQTLEGIDQSGQMREDSRGGRGGERARRGSGDGGRGGRGDRSRSGRRSEETRSKGKTEGGQSDPGESKKPRREREKSVEKTEGGARRRRRRRPAKKNSD
ncbi:DEAD/DEAH box helicase [Rothia sp. LK2588]|uniref:DEAD/DEAH box helicase n=1 Tax=Rothia sp. LK2588 TaxID=3114369 RepID=UPI0034CDC19C